MGPHPTSALWRVNGLRSDRLFLTSLLSLILLAVSGCVAEEPLPALSTDIPTPYPTGTPPPTTTLTPSPGPSLTLTPLLNVSALPPTPLVTETLPPAFSVSRVGANSHWQPLTRSFDGVEMVLVPPGCFTMGSESGSEDEWPSSQQCFDAPFWIDRTEVTNARFGSEGFFSGPDIPRDTVSYPEAVAHCAARDARLPTEAEWEYAARGPDSWMYPWGNSFEDENVVYTGNSGGQTAPVASRPGGASWVGALDLSGNLWEWTSSIYDEDFFPYPYDAADGREDQTNTNASRSIRGGSYSNEASFQRAITRKNKHPAYEWYGYVGFRCARTE